MWSYSTPAPDKCDDDQKELLEIPQQELLQSLARLHESSEYSDLTIEAGDRSYQVHRSIIRPRCSFPLFESKDDDGREWVDLTEEDPIAVRLMIHYMYRLDYPRLTHAEVEQTKVALAEKKAKAKPEPQDNDLEAPSGSEQAPQEPTAAIDSEVRAEEDVIVISQRDTDPLPCEVASGDRENVQVLDGTSMKLKKKKKKVSRVYSEENQKAREPDEDRVANLLIHVRMYMISGKYGIKGLQHLAKVRFAKEASTCVELPGFLEAAEIIYSSIYIPVLQSGWALQDEVVRAIRKAPSVLDTKDMQGLLIKTPELSLRLLLQQNDYTRKD